MIEINNLDEWIKEYFAKPENKKKAEKATERYDRLMVRNIRRQMGLGVEHIHVIGDEVDDPGKVLEKAKYEYLPVVRCGGEKGKLRINLVEQTAEFFKEEL